MHTGGGGTPTTQQMQMSNKVPLDWAFRRKKLNKAGGFENIFFKKHPENSRFATVNRRNSVQNKTYFLRIAQKIVLCFLKFHMIFS